MYSLDEVPNDFVVFLFNIYLFKTIDRQKAVMSKVKGRGRERERKKREMITFFRMHILFVCTKKNIKISSNKNMLQFASHLSQFVK